MTIADLTKIQRQGIQPDFPYSGRVIDNNDPELGQRVRARVQDLHNEVDDELLTWARPEGQFQFAGAGPETGSFSVPEVGTQVYIIYPGGDAYNPVWRPYGVDSTTIPEEAKEDYPYTHVLFKLFKNIMRYNRKMLKWVMRFDKDIDLTVDETAVVKVGKDLTITIGGDKRVHITGACVINCQTAEINAEDRVGVRAKAIDFYGDTTIHGDGRCTQDWYVGGRIHGTHS